jgi:hypothetical protein
MTTADQRQPAEADGEQLTASQLEQRWRTFGNWLRDTRAALGFSRAAWVAYTASKAPPGVSYQTQAHLENVWRRVAGAERLPNPSDAMMVRLAQALTAAGRPTTPDALFERVGGRQRERPALDPTAGAGEHPRASADARLRRVEQELARLQRLVAEQEAQRQPGPRRSAR